MAYRIGVDLGGTNIAAGLVTDGGEIIKKISVKTPRTGFSDVCLVISDLCKKLSLDNEITSVGIGSPGICVPETGMVERWSNLGFENVPLASAVKELTGFDVFIDNDANAAALGEYLFGAGRGTESFVLVTLGTGVGCGAVLDGRLFRGDNHSAFEAGHTVIDINGPLCTCGRRGCFETLASATALVRQAKEAAAFHPESLLNECEISGRTVFSCLEKGDSAAKSVVSAYIRYLAAGIVNLINISQPRVLCIGGGISGAGDALFTPLKELVSKEEYAKSCKIRTKILPALLGNDAGIAGAAAIPMYL